MFTGIISDVGEVVAARREASVARFAVACGYAPEALAIGASVACSGPCLTISEIARATDGRTVLSVDVSAETLLRTTLGNWDIGTRINLERSLKVGDELGGHLVTGHIDGVAQITDRRDEGATTRFDLAMPGELARFVAEKGSVALDGTSLTVNGVDDGGFWVTLIPYTLTVTTWAERRPGDQVNLEIDLLARYVARLAQAEKA